MASTSLRFTNAAHLLSYNTTGGAAETTILNDCTSFSIFWRQGIAAINESFGNIPWELSTTGGTITLNAATNGSTTFFHSCFIWVNNGTNEEQIVVNFPQSTPGPGVDIYAFGLTGSVSGGRWTFTTRRDGETAQTYQSSAGYDKFGRVAGTGYRLKLGQPYAWPSGTTTDQLFDQFALWKNYAATAQDFEDYRFGIVEPTSVSASNLAIYITGDGTLGNSLASGDAGRTNQGHASLKGYFDTATTALGSPGSATYGDPLDPQPTLALEAWIPESGKSIAFRLKAADSNAEFTPAGTFNSPYPATLPWHPSIRVNGGSPVTLANPLYYRPDGPRFVYYPLTGSEGVLGSAIGAGDAVTFSVAKGWLKGIADAALSITPAYTNAAVMNRAGNPDSIVQALPATRTLKAGVNGHRDIWYNANIALAESSAWQGGGTLDARGELTDTGGSSGFYLWAPRDARPGRAWWATTESNHYLGTPYARPGRWRVEWDGAFTWTDANANNRDRIRVDGASLPQFGPFAGKPVAFHTVSNVVATQGASNANHSVEFDLAPINSNTGVACTGSVGGDDFVRPSRALDVILTYEARGGGARTNLRVYPPGNAGQTYDKHYKDMLTEIAPHTFRTLWTIAVPNWSAYPNMHYLTRLDDPTRRRVTYPTYKTQIPVASVAMYTDGGYNAGLVPTGKKGMIVKITTTEPHGFTEGTLCTITDCSPARFLPVQSFTPANAADDQIVTDGGVPWSTGYPIWVRPISSTELVAPINWNNGYSFNPVLSATQTTNLGKLSVPWAENYHTPAEVVGMAVAVGSIPWLHITNAFDDAAITEFATHIAGLVTTGQKVIFEYANEIWNNFFPAFGHSYCASGAMPGSGASFTATVSGGMVTGASIGSAGSGYFFGHDGYYDLAVSGGGGTGAKVRAHFVNGVAASLEIVAGGSGYTSAPTLAIPPNNRITDIEGADVFPVWMAFQTQRLRKLARAAFQAAGRNASDVMVALSGQGENVGYMQSLALYAKRAGFPVDFIAPAIYDVPGGEPYTTASTGLQYWNDGTQYKSMDLDQNMDAAECYVAWHDVARPVRALREYLDANGMASVPIWSYEGSIESWACGHMQTTYNAGAESGYSQELLDALAFDWKLNKRIQHHPRARRMYWGWLKQYEDAGLAVFNYYKFGGTGGGQGLYDQSWDNPIGGVMFVGRGDGTDGRFDNRTDLMAFDKVVSTVMGGLRDWNEASATFTASAMLDASGTLTATGGLITFASGSAALDASGTLTATADAAATVYTDILAAVAEYARTTTAISSLTPGGLWHQQAPANSGFPCGVIDDLGRIRIDEYAEERGQQTSFEEGTFQIRIQDPSRETARSVGQAVARKIRSAADAYLFATSEGTVIDVRPTGVSMTTLDPEPGRDGKDIWQHMVEFEYVIARRDTD